jgi:beta-galactosidase
MWTNHVADEYVPYAVPQHHGTHIDTRWLELTNVNGDGIRFTFGRPTAFNVSMYSPDILSRAHTAADLVTDGVIYLHLDAALRGVGTGACGPDTSVRVPTGAHRLRWMATQVSSKRSRSRSTARRSSPPSSTR